MSKIDPHQVMMRTWLVLEEGKKRSLNFEVLSYEKARFKVEKDGVGFVFETFPGVLTLHREKPTLEIGFKDEKRKFLVEAGLPVPKLYGVFKKSSDVLRAKIKFPVVVKPRQGSFCDHVHLNVDSPEKLEQAAKDIEATKREILVEEMILGDDFRILFIDHHYVGCVERRAASVTGDGERSVQELIDRRNLEPCRHSSAERHTTNRFLVFDETSAEILKAANLTLKSVLPPGKILKIQHKIASSLGTDYIDNKEKLHSDYLKVCEKFTRQHNLFMVGFDLLSLDITKSYLETHSAFNEFNIRPCIDLIENNNLGEKRPAAVFLWDKVLKEKIFTSEFLEY